MSINKIIVIGGSGFVGTYFCKLLKKKKIAFKIIDLKKSLQFPEHSIIGDVRDLKSMQENIFDTEIVINLAAVHTDNLNKRSTNYYNTNVLGAENIAKACSEKKINKIIFTSSVAVYGFADDNTSENGIINPFNEYGRTKFLAEERFREWNKLRNNSLIIIRPTVIFGEGNRGNVYNLFNQIAKRRFIMIGNGNNKKSLAYVRNFVEFLYLCTKIRQKYGLYNYVDEPNMDMNSLVSIVRNRLIGKNEVGLRLPFVAGLFLGKVFDLLSVINSKKFTISYIRIKKFCSTSDFTSSKNNIKEFKPPYTLREGIENTLKTEFIDPNPLEEVFFTE